MLGDLSNVLTHRAKHMNFGKSNLALGSQWGIQTPFQIRTKHMNFEKSNLALGFLKCSWTA